ncbi:carbon storage regulator [Crateriforma conspicua]|uniref:Translational regulator CsrA n=1 Tax=Crateriforma conspicua TaxID=2527996 RepID=A0A5C6G259_9PLAN|nr:carbon storage regulator [Crateriforma conspicua]TWU67273.1 carbon storage regulator [Crateriforma conspicua]
MLVLSRVPDETIVIGEGDNAITIKLLSCRKTGRVRIGISAPRELRVLRGELTPRGDDSMPAEGPGHVVA